MTFTELRNGMSVMDGARCVAVARPVGIGGWLLKHHAGCWVDPRARKQGIVPGRYPGLLHVESRREARAILIKLAEV